MRKLLLLLVCAATVGCSDFFGVRTPTPLEEARFTWDTVRPDAYVFAIERMCFCPVDYLGPVRLRVVGDSVAERVYVDSGDPVPASHADAFPTVDGLFDILAAAYEQDAHDVRVTYDPQTGVPLDFWIDYSQMIADEELGFEVTEPVAPPTP
jgi:hypothetical protein